MDEIGLVHFQYTISYKLEICAIEEVSKKSSPIKNWHKDSTVSRYFGIGQECKIHYTCNHLMLISRDFSVTKKVLALAIFS